MSPLQELRLWFRRAPVAERAATAGAGIVVVALVAWALVPYDDDGGRPAASVAAGATAPGTGETTSTTTLDGATAQPGTVTSAGPTGSVGPSPIGATTGTGGGSTAGAAASAGSPTGGRCSGLTASDQGVTPESIHIAVSVISLAGPVGNSTFNIRGDLHQIVDALTDSVNKSGGVACRKLVVTHYDVNPLDQSDGRSKCLAMAQAKVFAVLDYAGYVKPVSRACFPEHQLPVQTATSLGDGESQQGYPYLYSAYASSQRQVRDWVFGAKQMGLFDAAKGFKKLGLLEDACDPSVNEEIDRDLAQVGVTPGQVSKFVLDCSLVSPPNQLQQAVLQHKLDGATHVLPAVSVSNAQNYVQIAEQQGYSPTYTASDYGSVTTPAGSWNAKGWDKTIGINTTRSGELASGLPNPEVTKCNKVMTDHGLKPQTTEVGSGPLAFCDLFSLFVAAMAHAGPNPRRTDVVVGLSKVGRFHSAAFGDGMFDRPRKVSGGDFYRPIQWHADCSCWKVLDPTYRPGF